MFSFFKLSSNLRISHYINYNILIITDWVQKLAINLKYWDHKIALDCSSFKKIILLKIVGALRGCLVCVFKQSFSVFKQYFMYFHTLFHLYIFSQKFSVFKQYFMYFHTLFHLYIFSQKFSNNNFQFLNTYTKRFLNIPFEIKVVLYLAE